MKSRQVFLCRFAARIPSSGVLVQAKRATSEYVGEQIIGAAYS